MSFKYEVSLGTIIELFSLLLVVLGVFRRIGEFEAKFDFMYKWFEQNMLENSAITFTHSQNNKRVKSAHNGE